MISAATVSSLFAGPGFATMAFPYRFRA